MYCSYHSCISISVYAHHVTRIRICPLVILVPDPNFLITYYFIEFTHHFFF